MLDKLAQARKFLVTALGSLLTVLTFTHNLPFLPANVSAAVGIGIAAITSILTWLVPNAKPALP
jgi:hypothetical protein